ncbi:M6 family metalloprotease domain-containing protein [Marinifilum caeruleilacunae]|uniref:M6 family metalloprotease domain-containing protein n=1 Tax=Marinifilum caeruleilacunae TaxID=2499076 RepID=A0ABX1WWV8_9BACT|nr:M6 family metalloprotease domain-containing protein [Marinifilum caeruleilacunae]NOU60383.1 M6 family metalloprotease domain-containing protein [Marinifilum caeruleilacunae]
MFKYTTNLLFVLFFSIQVFAQTDVPTGAPVCNDPIQITILNGNKLEVICRGDSRLHWMETEDGYMLSQFENQYFFAKIADGKLIKTDITVSKANITANRTKLNKLRIQNDQALSAIQYRSKSLKTIGGVPAKGKIKIPVLLVDFANQLHTRSKENVEEMFSQDGHNNYGSVKEYYLRASHNQLDIEFEVFGWYQSGLTTQEVAENKGGKAAGKLVKKAVELAHADGVDFSPYDNDGDGDADVLVVMHAGLGADHYGQEEYIWPRSWALQYTVGLPQTYGDLKVNDYVIACEMREYDGSWQDAGIGTFVHEFGHALGLPDLYDGTGNSNGLGHWAIMSAGSWLNRGYKPSNFCAWARVKMGWDEPKVLQYDDYGNYSMNSSNINQNEVYRINTTNDNEYFLLANKQAEGNDIGQPASGLAIFHINEQKANQDYNVNDDRDNPGVRFVEADFNENQGLYNAMDRGKASDLFPGTTNKTEFGPHSNPNSNLFNGEGSEVWIRDIKLENALLSFSLNQVTGITSIDETSDLILYPNPVKDYIKVRGSREILANASIEIYHANGSKMLEKTLNSFQDEEQINLQFLPKGVYLIKIISDKNIYSKKIVKY